MTPARIHISYSDRHFHPDIDNPDTLWFSCSQIAMHFWLALTRHFTHVTYGNRVPDEPIDLLWANSLLPWKPSVKRRAYFASVGHYDYVHKRVRREANHADKDSPEGLYPLSERWNYYLTLRDADFILGIGNNTIKDSFERCSIVNRSLLKIIDCGIDTSNYKPNHKVKRENIFIHNVTRFSVRKGSHIVASAWKRVSEDLQGARLLLLGREGDVDLRRHFKGFENVIFGGAFQGGSRAYVDRLSSARWVLQPSLAEGQAGTLLEAMSCGCVPIASRDTGIDADVYGGYPIKPNTPDALAENMIIANRKWNTDTPIKVRNIVKNKHNWNRFENIIIACTHSLLERTRKIKKSNRLVFFKDIILNQLQNRV